MEREVKGREGELYQILKFLVLWAFLIARKDNTSAHLRKVYCKNIWELEPESENYDWVLSLVMYILSLYGTSVSF